MAGMAAMMLPSNPFVKPGCLDIAERRDGSVVHDEGHREGGPSARPCIPARRTPPLP